MPKICISPGHGGKYRSNKGPTGYVEADGVLDISLRCRNILRNYPQIQVVMVRETDKTVEMADRLKMAEKEKCDIIIDVHTNASSNKDTHGTSMYHSVKNTSSSKGWKLASALLKNVVAEAGTKSLGLKQRKSTSGNWDYYYMIRETKIPCVIAELEYHTNPSAEAKLKTPEFRHKLAMGLAKGILEFYGISQKTTVEEGGFSMNATVVNVSSVLNVRKGPGTNYAVIGKLNPNARIKVVDTAKGWHMILYGTGVGYVSADYVKLDSAPKLADDKKVNELENKIKTLEAENRQLKDRATAAENQLKNEKTKNKKYDDFFALLKTFVK